MTDRKPAPLSATLLARKGSARPAGLHGAMPHDLGTEDGQDNILEPVREAGFSRGSGDGAPLAPELLSIHPIQPADGGSTALRAGPRPGAQRLWAGDTELTDLSRKRGMSARWWLLIAIAIILAVMLAALFGLAWGPIDGAQDPAEVSSSLTPPPLVLQTGRGAARVTLPPLAVSDATRPNADLPTLAVGAAPTAQKLATLRAVTDRVSTGPRLIAAGTGLAAATPQGTTAPREADAATLKLRRIVEAPKVVPPSRTRDTVAPPGISAWLPQRKPAPSQTALLANGGSGVFVQLGSVKSAVSAVREWDRLVGEFPAVLSGRPLKIERVALANRGDFYRIRTGPISGLTRARAICAEFVARDRGCLVVRR